MSYFNPESPSPRWKQRFTTESKNRKWVFVAFLRYRCGKKYANLLISSLDKIGVVLPLSKTAFW